MNETPDLATARHCAIDVALLVAALLASGGLALRLGQDFNFDHAQYHLYLGWSLLAERLDQDIAPAGIGSYFNPLLQVPTYLGSTLPPRVYAFALAALQGLNAFLAYRLALRVLRGLRGALPCAAVAGLVAGSGPCAVSLLGTSFGDNLPSLLVLGSLLLLTGAAEDTHRAWLPPVLLAGLLGGAAAALKLTFVVFALALAAGAAVVALARRRFTLLVVFAAGGVLGALLTGGYWGYQLWDRFANPVFPFANQVFRSPFIGTEPMSDPVYHFRGPSDILSPALDLALGRTERLMEISARDLRYLVLIALLALLLASLVANLAARRPALRPVPAAVPTVLAVWCTGYLAWTFALHNYRYFATGEFLAPVAILALLRWFGTRRLALIWVVLACALVLTTRAGSWGRIRWRPAALRVEVPTVSTSPPSVVLVDAITASWVLPFFPPQTRFLGLQQTTPRLLDEVRQVIAAQDGPIYRLTLRGSPSVSIEGFGLVETDSCETFGTGGRGRFRLCLLRPSASR